LLRRNIARRPAGANEDVFLSIYRIAEVRLGAGAVAAYAGSAYENQEKFVRIAGARRYDGLA